jgi:hypothetical protein
MAAAERHGEFIAHLAAERAALGEADVVRVDGPPPAHEAWLGGDKSEMDFVGVATGRCESPRRSCVDARRN